MTCIFCDISAKKISSNIIYENDNILAFHDITPVAPTHVLLIPKAHIDSVNHITEKNQLLLGELLLKAKQIAKKLGVNDKGYRLVINTNDDAGQSVEHLHLHLLANRKMAWPPG